MITNFTEVYEAGNTRDISSNIPFKKRYETREVFINTEQIVCLRPHTKFNKVLSESSCGAAIDRQGEFTRVFLNRGQSGMDLIVVGSPAQIQDKVVTHQKLLKG